MKKNKFILLLLALLFIAPSIGAYLFYLNPQWLAGKTTNKGHFVRVEQNLPIFDSKKWHIVMWSPNKCRRHCMKHLEQLTRVRAALGRRYYDVDLWLIIPENKTPSATNIMRMQQQHIKWRNASSQDSYNKFLLNYEETTFIVTPTEKVVLEYNHDATLDDIYHDLKHLLTTTDGKIPHESNIP